MAVKKKGLGKGLDSLIPEKSNKPLAKEPAEEKRESESGSGIQMMKINMVEPNRDQPRKKFDEDAILELADSIKQFGVLQPLLVRKNKDYYEIIAGERRWRAAKQAGVKEVPVIVKEYTEQEIVEIGLIENIQRENLNPIEEAMAFKRLLEEFNLKQDEVAERVSKSRTAVTNSMRLLKLDERVQQMIIDDMISTGHARALLAIDDKDEQYNLANRIFDEKLSVRDTEKLVKEFKNPKKTKEKVLFILYVNVTMKYNRLKNSYATFMKGKDGKSLEQSLKDKFEEAEAVLKFTKQNRTEIRELNRKLETNYQKVGIVKYDAFNEMGGKLSFALAMLDGNDSGWIINAMHSREGCYTYVKEIVKGESYVELAEEEAEALDKAIFHDIEKIEKSEIIEK